MVPFDGGHANLLFIKDGDDWICKMSDSFMQDLQSLMNGQEPKQPVKWIDIGDLGS
jgi:hypothetical protein